MEKNSDSNMMDAIGDITSFDSSAPTDIVNTDQILEKFDDDNDVILKRINAARERMLQQQKIEENKNS